ncbi:hypothetical protein YC2023_036179 [Brassica napus]
MCDDEIQGEDASEPCLARKRRKETERSSYALSPKPRKLVAHRVKVWEFFTRIEDDPTQNNCCLCEFLEADEKCRLYEYDHLVQAIDKVVHNCIPFLHQPVASKLRGLQQRWMITIKILRKSLSRWILRD